MTCFPGLFVDNRTSDAEMSFGTNHERERLERSRFCRYDLVDSLINEDDSDSSRASYFMRRRDMKLARKQFKEKDMLEKFNL